MQLCTQNTYSAPSGTRCEYKFIAQTDCLCQHRYGCGLAVGAGPARRHARSKCFADLSTSVVVEQDAVHDSVGQHGQASDVYQSSYFLSVSPSTQGYQPLEVLQWPASTVEKTRIETYRSTHRRVLRTLKAVIRVSRRQLSYDVLTKVLAAASVLPALILAVQPLLAVSGSTGAQAAATAVQSVSTEWQGPLRDMFSFIVLLSVFITCEPGAAASAAVCAAGGAIALFTGPAAAPLVATHTVALLAAAAAVILLSAAGMRTLDSSNRSSSRDKSTAGLQFVKAGARALALSVPPGLQPGDVLRGVQQALGVLGGGLLLQFLACSWPNSLGLPAVAEPTGLAWLSQVLAGGAAVVCAGQLAAPHRSSNQQLQQLWDDWPAWSATLLLILQPLQQLVTSALQTSELLPAISPWQQLLLVFASGLMVPRALLLGELMWFTGTSSGAMLAAGQLAVLAVHRASGGDAAACVLSLVCVLVGVGVLLRAGWRQIAEVQQLAIGN